jgi:hypothetical protein
MTIVSCVLMTTPKKETNAIFNEKLKVHIAPSSFRSTSFINTILLSKEEEVINKNFL